MERKWNENIENWENTKVILWTTFKKKEQKSRLKKSRTSWSFKWRSRSNPTIYQLIADLDTSDAERKGGISFDDFLDEINNKLGDKESKERIRRIFNLFIDDPNADTIKFVVKNIERIGRKFKWWRS